MKFSKILFLLVFLIMLASTIDRLKPVKYPIYICGWCKGKIYYHKIEGGIFQEYEKEYFESDGKAYHHFCAKMIGLKK